MKLHVRIFCKIVVAQLYFQTFFFKFLLMIPLEARPPAGVTPSLDAHAQPLINQTAFSAQENEKRFESSTVRSE